MLTVKRSKITFLCAFFFHVDVVLVDNSASMIVEKILKKINGHLTCFLRRVIILNDYHFIYLIYNKIYYYFILNFYLYLLLSSKYNILSLKRIVRQLFEKYLLTIKVL